MFCLTLTIISINEKLNAYTYIISHDLKEPIRSIRTFSEFILEDYEETFDETGKDYFNRIIIASNKMANMISDLLTLSKIGKVDVQFEKVLLQSLLEDVIEDMEPSIKDGNAVITFENLDVVCCQPIWMKTVLSNLLGNAIKYRDESKTQVQIHISMEEDSNDAGMNKVTMIDNGIGIDKSQHEKVFGLFRRATRDKNREGSGAGLAIVKSVINEHGGDVWIDQSELGIGTKICFTLKKEGITK